MIPKGKEQPKIARVFWPSHCNKPEPGYIIGWNTKSFTGCVACIIDCTEISHPQQLCKALQMIEDDPTLSFPGIHKYCNGPPLLLGLWNPPDSLSEESPESDSEHKNPGKSQKNQIFQDYITSRQNENIWLTMELKSHERTHFLRRGQSEQTFLFDSKVSSKKTPQLHDSKLPHLRELHCVGYRYETNSQIVFYTLPSPDHIFSSVPLSLDLHQTPELPSGESFQHFVPSEELEHILHQINCSLLVETALRKAIEKLRQNPELLNDQNPPEPVSQQEDSSPELSLLPSSSNDSEETLRDHERSPEEEEPVPSINIDEQASKTFQKLEQSYSKRATSNAIGLGERIVWWFVRVISLLAIVIQAGQNSLKEGIFGRSKCWSVLYDRVLRHSSTLQQLRMRAAVTTRFPWVWLGIFQQWPNHPNTRRTKIMFCTMFLLITIDSILGFILGSVLISYSSEIVQLVRNLSEFFTQTIVVSNIRWLMGWPAGFKLNDNVDSFMGQLFLFYNQKWIEWLKLLPISYEILVFVLGLTGVLGVSMILSIVLDVMRISTMHIRFFYSASARIYMHQLQAISALWKLFRGKKRNVLRNRIDSCQFDIDQLLLGTILFTVLFFLFPTIAIYYLYFSLVRFLLFSCHMVIFCLLQILNHFPIYGILLYLFDSSLFPGGVYFGVLGHSEVTSAYSKQTCSYLILRNRPAPFGNVFHYFKRYLSEFKENNSFGGLVSSALFGLPMKIVFRSESIH